MKVYLINKQDNWCPENNNGDYFIEAWSTEEKALNRLKELNKKDNQADWYYVHAFDLDKMSDLFTIDDDDYDPTPYCSHCGAMRRSNCDCGPIPDND